MKKLYILTLILISSPTIVVAQSSNTTNNSEGGADVYNFFFQKSGGGDLNVNKAGNRTKKNNLGISGSTIEDNNLTGSTTATSSEYPQKPKSNKHWFFQVSGVKGSFFNHQDEEAKNKSGGYIRGARTAKGADFDIQYNLNRYFGVNIGISRVQQNLITVTEFGHEFHSQETYLPFHAGLTVTPLHIDIFGNQLMSISALGGFTSANSEAKEKIQSYIGAQSTMLFGSTFFLRTAFLHNLNSQRQAFLAGLGVAL